MKRRIIISLLIPFAAFAGVPLGWSVDVTRVEPVRLDAYHGETLDLSATLMQGRRPIEVPAGSASFLWQTNGMGAAWWQTNATVSADGVVRGTFGPAMDTGADAVRFFFSVVSGSGANYRAAGTISLRLSPGATPTTADLAPQTAINFADYQLVNAPWITSADAAESIRSATNALETVLKASDTALASALADAAQAATNYADSVASAGNSALVAATNVLAAGGAQLVATAAQAASNYTDAAVASIDIPSLTGYATEAWVQGRGYLTQHQSLAGYATTTYADAAASNAQVAAIAAFPSLSGYATEQYVSDAVGAIAIPSLSGYATTAYADAAASNAQAAAVAAIPSLVGYATEQYVSSAIEAIELPSLDGYATSAYADAARSAAEAYARSLSWGASAGNTRLVTLDGSAWQDATGTVWQVSYVYGWAGTVIDLQTSAARPITLYYAGKTTTAPNVQSPTDYWSAGAGTNLYFDADMAQSWELWMTNDYHGATNECWQAEGTPTPPSTATNLSFNTAFELYTLFYQPVALATNPVDRVLYASASGDAATAERALTYGTPTRWTDATGCVWEVHESMSWIYQTDPQGVDVWSNGLNIEWNDGTYEGLPDDAPLGWFIMNGPMFLGNDANATRFEYSGSYWDDAAQDIKYANIVAIRGSITNLVGRVALTNDLPDTASITNDLADLRTESALVYRLYSGSNVVAEVTNYNSQVHAPSLRLLQLNESNEYITVWTETNGLARTLAAATNYADGAILDRAAPRAWSRTTSGLGAEAPSNTTWISTPTTVIAGGFEYSKFVDTYGEVWVLTSNGMAAEFNPDTNAYFRITADDGTPVFSVEKSDAQLVGANAAGITVGETTITIPVPVVSSTAPTMYWRYSLSSGDWADETAVNPNYMAVDWTGGPGSWVCTISFDGGRPSSMFFKFNFLQEGGVVIRNNATTDLSSGIYVNGTKFVPTVSGNNLIWTKQ